MTATVPPAIRSGPVDAGTQLNRVKHTACPLCYRKGPMTVHQRVVVWVCGHWREIPPFGAGPPSKRSRNMPNSTFGTAGSGELSVPQSDKRSDGGRFA